MGRTQPGPRWMSPMSDLEDYVAASSEVAWLYLTTWSFPLYLYLALWFVLHCFFFFFLSIFTISCILLIYLQVNSAVSHKLLVTRALEWTLPMNFAYISLPTDLLTITLLMSFIHPFLFPVFWDMIQYSQITQHTHIVCLLNAKHHARQPST